MTRKIIFWIHLSLGLGLGLVIAVIAASGILLAFRPQVTAWAERGQSLVVPPAPDAQRLSLDFLAEKVREANPQGTLLGLSVFSDSYSAVFFNLGKDGVIYLDPYQGAVLGRGNPGVRNFFQWAEGIHRWFGFQGKSRETAKAVKGFSVFLFAFLILAGIYLWWPQRWSLTVFKVIGVPNLKLKGKPRDWNWHNAVGFWAAPWLLLIAWTGLVMAYPWANDLLYRLTGNEPPPRAFNMESKKEGAAPGEGFKKERSERRGKKERQDGNENKSTASLNLILRQMETQSPGWKSANLRFPQKGNPNFTVQVEEASAPASFTRSTLTLDAVTGVVVKWEPYGAQNMGRKLRLWARFIHTGEAGGMAGQLLAALASFGALLLVWTGFAMAWRRFWGRN